MYFGPVAFIYWINLLTWLDLYITSLYSWYRHLMVNFSVCFLKISGINMKSEFSSLYLIHHLWWFHYFFFGSGLMTVFLREFFILFLNNSALCQFLSSSAICVCESLLVFVSDLRVTLYCKVIVFIGVLTLFLSEVSEPPPRSRG
jgi:hypothetical protein